MRTKTKLIWLYIVKFKYLIALIIFAIWIVFIDQTNLRFKAQIKDDIDYLKNKKEFYKREIEKNEIYYKNLTTNPDAKERLARETYFMHKDNEDVFIIVEE